MPSYKNSKQNSLKVAPDFLVSYLDIFLHHFSKGLLKIDLKSSNFEQVNVFELSYQLSNQNKFHTDYMISTFVDIYWSTPA